MSDSAEVPKNPNKPGREPKLRPIRQQLIDCAERGMSQRFMAELCAVTPRSLSNWLSRGKREGKGEYFIFFHDFKSARARYVAKNLDVVNKAVDGYTFEVVKEQSELREVEVLNEDGTPQLKADGSAVTEYRHVVVSREVVKQTKFHPELAKWALQCKDREEWGSDAKELAELKKAFIELAKKFDELSKRAEES